MATIEVALYKKKMERRLRESEEKYRNILENMQEGYLEMDLAGNYTLVNDAVCRNIGYSKEELIGMNNRQYQDEITAQKTYQLFNRVYRTGEPVKALDIEIIRKNGTKVFSEISVSLIRDAEGKPIGFRSISRDITERKRMESKMQESEQKFRTLFENSIDAIYITTKEGRFIDFNQACLELFGYTKEEMVTIHVKDIYMNPADRNMFKKTMEKKGSVRDYVVKLRRKDGQQMDCIITATTRYADDGSISGYQGIFKDVTEQKRLEQQLHTMSLTDELTGLYNRRGFFTLAQQQLKVTDRTKKDLLLFFVDLDKMKQINDTLGHQEGDNALVEIATILKEVFRESDIIGRMGGDEFAILAIDTTDETGEVFIMRLHNTLDNYNRLEGRNYTLSLSIGIAHYDPETPAALDELMAQADTLMYEEKKRKQN